MDASAGTDIVRVGYWIFPDDSIRSNLNRPVSEIPSQLFTHLCAGFAVVDIDDGRVRFPTQYQEQFEEFPNTVRQQNPTVATLLSIGGPDYDMSQVARDGTRRRTFINESIYLARTFGYNGLDLFLQYPFPSDNGDDLIALLKEWRNACLQEELLLTAAVVHHPAIPSRNRRSFNYPNISFLDGIKVLDIDFYTPSNSSGETGPVHALNTSFQKLVFALPFHGSEWNYLINRNVYQDFALEPTPPANLINQYVYQDTAPAPTQPANYKKQSYRSEIQQKTIDGRNYQSHHKSSYVATSYSTKTTGKFINGYYQDETSISGKVTQANINIDGNRGTASGVELRLEGDGNNYTVTRAAFGGGPLDGRAVNRQ